MGTIEYFGACVAMAICIGFFLRVWKANNRASTVITPFLLFSVMEILINWPAAFLAPMMGEARDLLPLVYLLCGFVLFLIGVIVGDQVLKHRATEILNFRSEKVEAARPYVYFVNSLALLAFLLPISLFFYQGVPPIVESMEAVFRGADNFEVAISLGQSRRMLTKEHYFGGEYRGQGLLRMVLRVGWPFLVAIALTVYIRTRRKVWGVIAACWFVLTFVFVAGEGTRAPFLFSLIFLVVLISLLKQLKYRTIFVGAGLFIALMVGLSLMTTKLQWAVGHSNSVSMMVDSIVSRILYINGMNTIHITELIRDGTWDFRYGEVHLQRVLNAIPGVQWGTPFSHQLFMTMNPFSTETTYASATYFGDIYADFGPVGVVVIYFYLGLFVAFIQKLIFRIPRTVLNLPLAAYLIFAVAFIPLTGFVGFLSVLPVVAFVYLIPYAATRMISRRRVRSALPRLTRPGVRRRDLPGGYRPAGMTTD